MKNNKNINKKAMELINDWISNPPKHNQKFVSSCFQTGWKTNKDGDKVPQLIITIINRVTESYKKIDCEINGRFIDITIENYDKEKQLFRAPKNINMEMVINTKPFFKAYKDMLLRNLDLIFLKEYYHLVFKINITSLDDLKNRAKYINKKEKQLMESLKGPITVKEYESYRKSTKRWHDSLNENLLKKMFEVKTETMPDEIKKEFDDVYNFIKKTDEWADTLSLKRITDDDLVRTSISIENQYNKYAKIILRSPHNRVGRMIFNMSYDTSTNKIYKTITIELYKTKNYGDEPLKIYATNRNDINDTVFISNILTKELESFERENDTIISINLSDLSLSDVAKTFLILYNLVNSRCGKTTLIPCLERKENE